MQLEHWPKVVLFGDSLTQTSFGENGWGALIADKLQRKCDVLSRGFAGYNSCWCRIALSKLFPTAQSVSDVAAFVIFLGANDSNSLELNPRQHVPVDEFGENLIAMVKYLQSLGLSERKIILVGPPPCDTIAWSKESEKRGYPMAKDNKVAGLYNDKCRNAASVTSSNFIDLYSAMMNNQAWQSFFCDGLHLSPAGSQFLFAQLCPCVDSLTATLPLYLPEWDEVNLEDPASSLK